MPVEAGKSYKTYDGRNVLIAGHGNINGRHKFIGIVTRDDGTGYTDYFEADGTSCNGGTVMRQAGGQFGGHNRADLKLNDEHTIWLTVLLDNDGGFVPVFDESEEEAIEYAAKFPNQTYRVFAQRAIVVKDGQRFDTTRPAAVQ